MVLERKKFKVYKWLYSKCEIYIEKGIGLEMQRFTLLQQYTVIYRMTMVLEKGINGYSDGLVIIDNMSNCGIYSGGIAMIETYIQHNMVL